LVRYYCVFYFRPSNTDRKTTTRDSVRRPFWRTANAILKLGQEYKTTDNWIRVTDNGWRRHHQKFKTAAIRTHDWTVYNTLGHWLSEKELRLLRETDRVRDVRLHNTRATSTATRYLAVDLSTAEEVCLAWTNDVGAQFVNWRLPKLEKRKLPQTRVPASAANVTA